MSTDVHGSIIDCDCFTCRCRRGDIGDKKRVQFPWKVKMCYASGVAQICSKYTQDVIASCWGEDSHIIAEFIVYCVNNHIADIKDREKG